MRAFAKDHLFVLLSILVVAVAIFLRTPLFFSLIIFPVLLSLKADLRRYYLTALFIFLAFYGSYALFNIEPLYAPKLIKIGKDLIWIALLLFALPFLDWKKLLDLPKPLEILITVFAGYIIIHATLANPTWTGRLLEVRDYLEYVPLVFLPSLLIKKRESLHLVLEDFLLISAFVALFALVQDKIPGISVLGIYRVNSTLPNFFHMAMLLNAAAVLLVSVIVSYKDNLNKKTFAILLAFLGLFSYASLLSDSRGLDVALFSSLIVTVLLIIPVWKKSWTLLIPPVIAAIAFFSIGPSWASSRFANLKDQVTHTFITQKNQHTISTGVLSAVQQNLKLVNKETSNKSERDFTVSHSSDSSVANRAFNINSAIAEIKESPLVGHGMLLKNGDPGTAYATDFFALDSIVHLGFLGSVMFFAIVGSLVVWFSKFYWRQKDNKSKVLIIAFIGIIFQYLVSSMTTSSWISFPVNALFWLFAGLGVSVVFFKGDKAEKTK